jgi:hypothetical protein
MTAFPALFLDELRARLPVSEVVGRKVKLKKQGAEFKGLSPFQDEKSPSFTVNDSKGFYHDFSSGKHGDIFSFLMETSGIDFRAAVVECAQIAGLPLPADGGVQHQPAKAANGHLRHDEAPFDPDAYDAAPAPRQTTKREITKAYDYADGSGNLLYQVCRIEWRDDGKHKKTFMQRRPDGAGHWIWGLSGGEFIRGRDGDWYQATEDRVQKWTGAEHQSFPTGVNHGLYRLMELREEAGAAEIVYLPEGEKDVETLRGIGLAATTNSGGARNWRPDHAEVLRGRDVVILLDNDQPGRERGDIIARSLHGIASRIRLADFSGVWPDAPKGADVTDWVRQREGTAEELAEIAGRAPEWRPAPFESTMGLRMWADQDLPGAQYEYLIEDMIPERQVVVLMGDTGTGKSFLTFSMAMALARGVPFLGRRILKSTGVVWCAYEAAEGAGARMRAYRRHYGLSLEPLPFAALQHPLPLWPNEPNGDLLINEVLGIERTRFDGIRLGAIVVDTYNAATPGASEIDSEVVSRIRSYFRRAVAETGATLIIVGHTNSSGKHRGNEQLTNNVDTILKVSFKTRIEGREIIQIKDDDGRDIRTLKVIKQREGKQGDEFDFVLHAVKDGTVNKFGSARTSCVIVPFEGAGETRQRADVPKGPRLTYDRTVILNALRTAIEEHGEPTPGVLKLPRSISRVVKAGRWKDIYLQKAPDGGTAPDNTINKRLRDASNQFQTIGLIGRINPFVWIVPGKQVNEDPLALAGEQPEFPEIPSQ